jgi:hypothetical protein
VSGAEVLVTKAGTHDKAFAFVHLADGSNLATVKAEYAEDVAALIRAKLNPEAVSSEITPPPVEVGTITDAARYRYVRQHPEMLLHLSNKDFDAAIDKRRGSDDTGEQREP